MTEESEQQKELKKLEFIIGKWKTNGKVRATDNSPEIIIKGNDSYEFLANDHFILHVVNIMMGDEQVDNVEIIYFDNVNQNYPMQSFDNLGKYTTMRRHIIENKFILSGDKIRSTLTYNVETTEMSAFWERSDNGIKWVPWMDLKLQK
ncbi:MAG TPA: DUF1579 family protein [Flavobacterium sp.]|jgi:hypothetical protein